MDRNSKPKIDYSFKPYHSKPEIDFSYEQEVISSSKGSKMKDPFKCPLCSATVMCPRDKDYQEYSDIHVAKCLVSGDPNCKKAVKNVKNAAFIESVKIRTKS